MLVPSYRIVIADDHHLIREGLSSAIAKKSNHIIVAQAKNGKELIELVKVYKPDIVITDIKMPVLDGIEATKQIIKFNPDIGVIALSFMDNEYAVVDILQAGALGYLSKSADISEILEAISKVYNRLPYYCATTTRLLAKEIALSCFNPYKKFKPVFTEQELRVIRLISLGRSSKEVSDIL